MAKMQLMFNINNVNGSCPLGFYNQRIPIFLSWHWQVSLFKQGNTSTECCLILAITFEFHEQIKDQSLFNLKPEVQSLHTGNSFQPDKDIHLTITLRPDLLPRLLEHAQTEEEIVTYLSKISQEENAAEHPLLQTESWLALSVKQQQGDQEVGYNTFWSYINPAIVNRPDITSDELADGIVEFVKEWTQVNLIEATENTTAQFLKDISDTFGALVEDSFDDLKDDETPTLLETVMDFFEQEEWPCAKLSDESSLRLGFRGDNGQWTCYATVNEAQQTVVFYSICPISAAEEKRLAIAEFLTRASYGLILGNFELDFSDGEIRYKTSLDVEGDRLTPALMKNLVYTNVMTLDEYLPGIMAVLEQGLPPTQAIERVEQGESVVPELAI